MNSERTESFWIAGISLILLLALLPYSGYIASLPLIQPEWGMSNSQSGFVFSIYLIGYAVSSLTLVPFADRVHPGKMMVLGVSIMAAGNLMFPWLAQGMWSAAILRFVIGAGHVIVYVLGIQLASRRLSGRRRGTAVGIFVGMGYAGTTGSYSLFGLLLELFPAWRTAYAVTAVVSLAAVVLALALARNGKRGSPAKAEKAEDARPLVTLDIRVLKSRPVVLIILAYALHSAELFLARLWLPLLLGAALVSSGRPEAEATTTAATLSGFMFMTGIVGVFVGGAVSDRIGRARGGVVFFLLSGLCSFVIGWLVDSPITILVVLGFVYGFVTAADSAIYSTAAVELSPEGRVASVQALQSFTGFAIGAIAPVVAGAILDVAESSLRWGLAFSFSGLLAVIGLLALGYLKQSAEAESSMATEPEAADYS